MTFAKISSKMAPCPGKKYFKIVNVFWSTQVFGIY